MSKKRAEIWGKSSNIVPKETRFNQSIDISEASKIYKYLNSASPFTIEIAEGMALIQKCWLTQLIFLLLLMSRAMHVVDTRPTSRGSDLITGSEFLKLFMERDELQRNFQSAEYQGHGDGTSSKSHTLTTEENIFVDSTTKDENENVDASMKSKARSNARSINYNVHDGSGNLNRQTIDNDGKQVVKFVTSGSKIVFLEEFDEADDAVVDAVARDIDLKRERVKKVNHKTGEENRFYQQENKSTPNDEFKVVAVSVSSSSKRGSSSHQQQQKLPAAKETPKQVSKFSIKSSLPDVMESRYSPGILTTKRPFKVTITSTASTPLASTTTTTTSTPVAATNDIDDFINRSHKSEFSIEEAEPLTMPQKQHKMRRAHLSIDSQNSASTNVQKVLASPALISSASVRSSSIVPASVNISSTQPQSPARQARINHSGVTYDSNAATDGDDDVDVDGDSDIGGSEEKLLPFQTVIYHDTKEGHGPQSRSISYSSLSQNVDDLKTWEHTGSILAEAQRNVSESLKPLTRQNKSTPITMTQESEPSKFYSIPSKMYSIPSKFYSEPAKVYSEPAKVYGEPEKFYSEPAKVYGQPSKFYSEPSKVYSQPAKVYGEPAKTYWPQTTAIITTTTSTSTTTTTVTPASKSIITTFSPFSNPFNLTSRRPAIVSRIAFGEAQNSSPQPPVNFAQRTTTRAPPSGGGYRHENYHQPNHQNQYQSQKTYQEASTLRPRQNTQSRRVLFNLDKLPYDLLNAPEQHLLEPDLSKSQPNPCSPQHQQHSRQHSSSFSDQHSNQNAKGLPNRDLVKCVSKFSVHHSAESAARRPPSHNHFTTERSHIEELYRPTPEQNYEIEESVSVMTNGRAHGVQDGLGRGGVGLGMMTTTSTSTSAPPKVQASRNRLHPSNASGLRSFGHVSQINRNNDGEEHDIALIHQSNKNNNNNNNKKNNHHQHYLNNNDYNDDNSEDDDVEEDNNGDVDGDDDGNDDSKVAYVVEGRNYRKYRVEEKTDDGFIVGEFGVVNHNDGNLRGVRYTADSTINPSLIQKALLTFLKLK